MDIDQENKPLIGQPIVNGIIPSFDVLKNNTFQPIKSEGQDTRFFYVVLLMEQPLVPIYIFQRNLGEM